MYKGLVKKIEALKKDKILLDYVDCEQNRSVVSLITKGYNKAINEAVDIIKVSEPLWLDKPDEEDWWWFKSEEGYVTGYEVIEHDAGLIIWRYDANEGYHFILATSLKGKWQKAIVLE